MTTIATQKAWKGFLLQPAGSGCRARRRRDLLAGPHRARRRGPDRDLVSVKVGRKKRGVRVKPGRFYELRNGQVVEVTADGEAVA